MQLRYLALLMTSMLVPLIFIGGCFYYLVFTIMAEQLGVPEYIAYNLVPVINKINIILLVGILPIFALLMLWGIILSHRFAGPLERLEKEIKRIAAEGDYAKRIKVRKHDDMKPIVNAINMLLEKVEEKNK